MLDVFITLATGLIGVLVGSWVAFGRSKKENMWLEKKQVYIDILTCLHDLKYLNQREISRLSLEGETDSIDIEIAGLRETSLDSKRKLEMLSELGGFLISNKAGQQAESVGRDIDSETDRFFTTEKNETDNLVAYKFFCQRRLDIIERGIVEIKATGKYDIGM